MNFARLIAYCVVMVCVACVSAAGSAFAAAPEYGRCRKSAAGEQKIYRQIRQRRLYASQNQNRKNSA